MGQGSLLCTFLASITLLFCCIAAAVIQSLSSVQLFATPWTCRMPGFLVLPSLSPGVCSNSCPSSWWCHLTISFSAALFCCRKGQTRAVLFSGFLEGSLSEVDTVRGGGSGQINPWTLTSRKALILGATGLLGGIQAGRSREENEPSQESRAFVLTSTHLATCLSGGESQSVIITEEILFMTALETTAKTIGNFEQAKWALYWKRAFNGLCWILETETICFLEGNRRWWPLWLGWVLQLLWSYRQEHFQGSRQKANAAGPLTTSKTGGSAHGLPALSDTATSGVLQTESGAQSSHQTVPFFQKETRTTKQKQPKIQTHTRETFST